ncbi:MULTISPECIES: carbohydrate ABC transporter permease [Bacillales]|uniref:carbohydrate ABC transporter permease n=1 Tax=Bacillus sp. FJAT-26390 TaxID=1743142 RepID=UPI001E58DA39|nr:MULTISPECIES: carbohydrate ABC transporter permease [Bacillales]
MKLHRSKSGIKRSFFADFGIYLFLLLFGIFMMLPLVYAISNSIKPLEEIWFFPPRFLVNNPTLDNFRDLLAVMSDSWVPFSRYIFNTVFITAVGTAGHVVIASLCAYVLSKHKFPGKGIMFSTVVLSLMFSGVVTQIPNFIIISSLGWIDSYQSIIVPAFASSLGLYLMKQFMDQMIPDAILESARIDGASEWKIFWTIVMPMVKPAWLTLIIFSMQGLWGIGANHFIQSEELKTLNYALSQILAGGIARTGTGSAAAVLMMIVPIIVFIISQSKIIETMSASGMKE